MKTIGILYFSGAGATKKVAELMLASLSCNYSVDFFSLENMPKLQLNHYDALIIGTPVYHTAPARVVTNFFNSIHPLAKPIPAFIYNTRGLYSCNTNRILAKQLKKKNIVTIIDREYRSPASDGSLLVPAVKRFFEFERNLPAKITLDCNKFSELLQKQRKHEHIPRFRLSSILNAPNKLAGQLIIFEIHTHRDRCLRCDKCIMNCPHGAWEKGNDGYPVFLTKNCENCYRCIHHCPQMALSLSKRRKAEKVLQYR